MRSAEMIANKDKKAAIASILSAQTYGLEVLQNIENEKVI